MNKWIAEFELEDGDTMPEHMNLEYKGAKIDFHCRPKEPILDKIRAEIKEWYWQADKQTLAKDPCVVDAMIDLFIRTIDKYKTGNEK